MVGYPTGDAIPKIGFSTVSLGGCIVKVLQKLGKHMANENKNSPDNLELLKFLYEDRIGEIKFLRERQEKFFAWSSNSKYAEIVSLL